MQSFLLIGPLVLAVSVALAILLPRLAERFFPATFRASNQQSALIVGGTIASPFMIILGFMIVILWGQMDGANAAVQREADALRNVDALMEYVDAATSRRVRADIVAYARLAADEWPSLSDGHATAAAEAAFRVVRADVLAIATGPDGSVLIEDAVAQILEAQTYRSDRITAAGNNLPAALWISLAVGTILYLALIVLTDTAPLASRVAVTFVAVGVIGLSLLLVAMLDNPFRGDIRANPAPLTMLADQLSPAP